MFSIEYRKGDMLDNMNTEDIFVHACNGQHVWGRGIAQQLRDRFPAAYAEYQEHELKIGSGFIVWTNSFDRLQSFPIHLKGYKIGCLITSKGYGKYTDPPHEIAANTYLAVTDLIQNTLGGRPGGIFHSPKINSGLFNTPWQLTKTEIKRACEESGKNIKWIVWEL